MKLNKYKFIIFVIIFCVASLSLTLLQSNKAVARPEGIVLSTDRLPPGAQITSDENLSLDEESHPLSKSTGKNNQARANSTSSLEDKDVVSYSSIHIVSAFVPSHQSVVMNFAYQYQNPSQAQKSAIALRKQIASAKTLVKTINLKGGRAYMLRGDEGDYVYWFIGTTGRSLSLVLINGFGDSNVSSLFGSTVKVDLEKQADLVTEE